MRRSRETLALVDTATQLLNAAEWAYAAGECATTRIAVLSPTDRHSVRQIEQVAAVLGELSDLAIDIHPIREPGAPALRSAGSVVADLAAAPRLVLGDAFAGLFQLLLPLSSAEQVVLVDDGTGTWEYAKCIDGGKPLVRWRKPLRRRERRAERATRLLSPSMSREISVFTCLRDATPLGAVPLANRYTWTRAWRRPELKDEVDVLGTSLVSNGVVQRRPYLDAIAAMVDRHGPVRYVAHRRESDNLVAEIAAISGVRAVRPDLPVELALREGPVGRRLITFPSTTAHTLPIVLGDLGVRMDVRHVEPGWFTPGTTSHARDFIARISAQAPTRRRRLEIA